MATYYIWFIGALCLIGGELLTNTFYLLAVAIGAIAAGFACLLGMQTPYSFIIMALVSAAVFVLIRWREKRQKLITHPMPSLDMGQPVHILHWLDQQYARIQYRGTQWDAKLIGEQTETNLYQIVGQEGNIFLIRKKETSID